jgi:nitrilase
LTLAAAICWENFMPLLRQTLYSQNVNLYLAPTADGRDTWMPLMRTIAFEGRCVVLSANQCIRESDLPHWITGKKESADGKINGSGGTVAPARLRRKSTIECEDGNEIALPLPKTSTVNSAITEEDETATKSKKAGFISKGGSAIIAPMGEVLAGPLWGDDDGLLVHEVDFDDCLRGRLDLDVGGSYSRYVERIKWRSFVALTPLRSEFKLTVEGLDLSPPP